MVELLVQVTAFTRSVPFFLHTDATIHSWTIRFSFADRDHSSSCFRFGMKIIGLTGGMGCGKSTAADFFAEEGFRTLDTDAIVHGLLANDSTVRSAIRRRLGSAVFDDKGQIDRKRLGEVVFTDREALSWLEGLVHPMVGKIWRRKVLESSHQVWVIQIPLLFEKRLEQSFDFTVCVGTSAETQRRRLRRRGFSEQEVIRRISRQLPLDEKIVKADFFLLNDGSLEFLRAQIRRFCRQISMVH